MKLDDHPSLPAVVLQCGQLLYITIMALDQPTYRYLRELLASYPVIHPVRDRPPSGYDAAFRQCHVTSIDLERRHGWPAVCGVMFLDLHGKLYPWPHMMNRRDGILTDFSPAPTEPQLGFVEVLRTPAEIAMLDTVTRAYDAMPQDRLASRWSDPLAQQLSDDFMPLLARR